MSDIIKSCKTCRHKYNDACRLREVLTVIVSEIISKEDEMAARDNTISEVDLKKIFSGYKAIRLKLDDLMVSEIYTTKETIINDILDIYCQHISHFDMKKLDYDINPKDDFYCSYWE